MRKCYIFFFTAFVFFVNGFNARSQWVQTPRPPTGTVRAVSAVGNHLFAGTSAGALYYSPDDGATWTIRNENSPLMEVRFLLSRGSDLYAGTDGVGTTGSRIYKSNDLGITWVNITPKGMFSHPVISSLTIDGDYIFASTDDPIDTLTTVGVFKSSLIGIDSSTWTQFNTGFPTAQPYARVRALKVQGTNIYAGTHGRGVWVSSVSSPNWTPTTGMVSDADYIHVIIFKGGVAFAGNQMGTPVLYRSIDNGSTWMPSSTPIFEDNAVYSIIHDANTVYAGTELNGVMKSTDNGISWTSFNEGFKDSSGNWYCNQISIRSFVFKENWLFAGTDCGVWKRQMSVAPPVTVTDSSSKITIYPNPVSNTFTLRVASGDIGSPCIIKDANGSVVLETRITNQTTSIDVSRLSAGLYFVKIGYKRAVRFFKK
jgi:hypothetical protein